jgi:hypothetical protein
MKHKFCMGLVLLAVGHSVFGIMLAFLLFHHFLIRFGLARQAACVQLELC